jgi:hypothetical protein
MLGLHPRLVKEQTPRVSPTQSYAAATCDSDSSKDGATEGTEFTETGKTNAPIRLNPCISVASVACFSFAVMAVMATCLTV